MIPYSRQNVTDHDLIAVKEALTADLLTTGPQVVAFEQQLCSITGANYAIACSSGTAALHLACLGLGISSGDLGITSANTFVASANCIEYCGGSVDFLDIDMTTLCISPDKLRQYCEQVAVPKIVIAVSFAGVPTQLMELRALSQEFGFYLVEDAAHAIGSTYTFKGVEYQSGSCSHSDLAIFSFHPVKTVTTIEGGAVLTNDLHLANRIRLFRSHGITRNSTMNECCGDPWYYEMQQLGFHYRLTDVQCALGISQLAHLQENKARRQQIWRSYSAAFEDDERCILPSWPSWSSPCFHLYPLQFKEGPVRRRLVYDTLASFGIGSQVHYIPIYWQPYYKQKYGYELGRCPDAEKYYSRCLSIPFYFGLREEDIESVISAVREALKIRI